MKTVLVTGGSGLVGSALQQLRPEWFYINSKDCNLLCKSNFTNILKKIGPDIVIHLAADVGGLFKNKNNKLKMYENNITINENVINSCYEFGCKRLICCLSTCVFPDGLNKILTEEDLHCGEPHISNFGYAYAKRMMEVHCRLINENEGYNYQCIVPTNIYGENDNFDLDNSHVIPGLIHKAYIHTKTMKNNNDENIPLIIKGDGTPLRQFIYSHDLARIIVILIEKKIMNNVIICSPNEHEKITIYGIAKKIANEFDINNVKTEISNEKICEDNGQYEKTCTNKLLMEIIPDFEFTPLDIGLKNTIKWFLESKWSRL